MEVTSTDAEGCLVCSTDGASGIRKLELNGAGSQSRTMLCESEACLLKPDANTNIMRQRTVIPVLKSAILSNTSAEAKSYRYLIAAGVFAMADQKDNVVEKWNDIPVISFGNDQECDVPTYIKFDEW